MVVLSLLLFRSVQLRTTEEQTRQDRLAVLGIRVSSTGTADSMIH